MGEIDLSSPLSPALLMAILGGGALAGVVTALAFLIAGRVSKETHRVGEAVGGERVEVVEWSGTQGYVRVGGELWRAQCDSALAPGERVRVTRADGLVLEVSKQ